MGRHLPTDNSIRPWPFGYVLKWHNVYDASHKLLQQISRPRETSISDRALLIQSRVKGCKDIDNEEAAYEHGETMDTVLDWFRASLPLRTEGGTRRCILRIHTWEIDEEGQIGYNPKWLTIGGGQTGHATVRKAARWCREYIESIDKGYVSREVLVTAVEIVFWTSAYRTDYL